MTARGPLFSDVDDVEEVMGVMDAGVVEGRAIVEWKEVANAVAGVRATQSREIS
eukprot:IDg19464t1